MERTNIHPNQLSYLDNTYNCAENRAFYIACILHAAIYYTTSIHKKHVDDSRDIAGMKKIYFKDLFPCKDKGIYQLNLEETSLHINLKIFIALLTKKVDVSQFNTHRKIS